MSERQDKIKERKAYDNFHLFFVAYCGRCSIKCFRSLDLNQIIESGPNSSQKKKIKADGLRNKSSNYGQYQQVSDSKKT